jgi:hypothetical protein
MKNIIPYKYFNNYSLITTPPPPPPPNQNKQLLLMIIYIALGYWIGKKTNN